METPGPDAPNTRTVPPLGNLLQLKELLEAYCAQFPLRYAVTQLETTDDGQSYLSVEWSTSMSRESYSVEYLPDLGGWIVVLPDGTAHPGLALAPTAADAVFALIPTTC